jgi:hypothetical protein
MSRTDSVVAFPSYYRSAPCSSRFTPGFVSFRLRARDTPRFKKGTIDLTSVQYLICIEKDGDIEFSIVQAKDLFVGMSASRRMENRHVVLRAGATLWRDIGDLKSWSDEVDLAGLTGDLTAALAHIVISPTADGSPPCVEVTKAFDAAAFESIDRAVPFSIVPPTSAICATNLAPRKYGGVKFVPEAIGMASVTTEQREKLLSSRKRRSSEDASAEREVSYKRTHTHDAGEQPAPLDMTLEELLGIAGSNPEYDDANDNAQLNLEQLLFADEGDAKLPPLPEVAGGFQRSDSDDLDQIFKEIANR